MSEPTAPDLAAQLQAAIAHHQAGELAEAEQGYRAILAEQANHPDAWHNLGILALQVEQHDTALELLRGVLQAYPQHGQFWISYLQALMRIGQFDLARAVLAQGRELGLDGEPVDAIARQPEAAGTISRTLFVGLAMIETMAIYCLVIALLLLFANPFIG